MKSFLIVKLTILISTGILIGQLLNLEFQSLQKLTIIIGALFYIIYKKSNAHFLQKPYFFIGTIISFIFIGVLLYHLNQEKNQTLHYTNHLSSTLKNRQLVSFTLKKKLKSNRFYSKYYIELIALNQQPVTGTIIAYLKNDSLNHSLSFNHIYTVKTVLKKPNTPQNPYQFDYQNYLKQHQIHHQINCSYSDIVTLPIPKKLFFLTTITQLKSQISIAFKRHITDENILGIINALLLGEKSAMSATLREQYANAGVIHILAISGLHVGIIAWLISLLLKPLHYIKNGSWVALILTLLLLWVYAFFTGLSASVIRATIMFSFLIIAQKTQKEIQSYYALFSSMFLILIVNPNMLFEIGFQLSYLAVFFILWLYPKIKSLWQPKLFLLKKAWELFSVSLAAQIGVLPLTIYYFHQFPGLFFISNLVVLPLLGFILCYGFLIIIFILFHIDITLIIIPYFEILDLLNRFIIWISSMEHFVFKQIPFNLGLLMSSYCIIIALGLYKTKRFYRSVTAILSTIILFQVILIGTQIKHQNHEFIVFNKHQNTIIGQKINQEVIIYSDKDTLPNFISDFTRGNFSPIGLKKTLQNYYKHKEESILLINQPLNYQQLSFCPSIIILSQSPKINLEALIHTINPRLIIADASNYYSYVARWKKTCIKQQLPFHYTREKGAFILD